MEKYIAIWGFSGSVGAVKAGQVVELDPVHGAAMVARGIVKPHDNKKPTPTENKMLELNAESKAKRAPKSAVKKGDDNG